MLTKRLRELERAGVVTVAPKTSGGGLDYRLTDAGRDLAAVVEHMAEWGSRWIDVTTEHSDPGFALWAWCQVQLDRSALPDGRVVVGLTFPDERPGNRRYWLLVEHGDAEVCYSDPGGTPDVEIVARSTAFVDWHRGALRWVDALRSEGIRIEGPRALVRSLPSWNRHEPVLDGAGPP